MLFDSHAHLDDFKFNDDREAVINSLKENKIKYVVNVGADYESSVASCNLSEKYDFIYAAVGVHPYDAADVDDLLIERLRELALKHKKVVAIGESGLDYSHGGEDKEAQKRAFIRHIELADSLALPVIVHNRDSHKDMMDILTEYRPKSAIIHCFSGSAEMAETLVKMGYYISFSGTVTFKNAKKVAQAAEVVPLDRILIETDSPYLSPEPERGTKNNPSKVKFTAEKIAEIKGLSTEEIARITTENAKRVYKIEE